MAEILTFAESSAQFATGNGSLTTQMYVRNATLNPQRDTYRYRVPHVAGYTHIDLRRGEATFAITIAEGPDTRAAKAMFAAAAPGTFHLHVGGLIGAAGALGSAGFFGYSGTIDHASLAGVDGGDDQGFTVNGWPQSWSAY